MKSRENETEKKPYINAGNYETKPKMRPKERNYRYCYAPNWNLNHKCPIREPTCHNCQKMDDSQKSVDFNTENNKKSKKYQGHRQIDKHVNQIIARNWRKNQFCHDNEDERNWEKLSWKTCGCFGSHTHDQFVNFFHNSSIILEQIVNSDSNGNLLP